MFRGSPSAPSANPWGSQLSCNNVAQPKARLSRDPQGQAGPSGRQTYCEWECKPMHATLRKVWQCGLTKKTMNKCIMIYRFATSQVDLSKYSPTAVKHLKQVSTRKHRLVDRSELVIRNNNVFQLTQQRSAGPNKAQLDPTRSSSCGTLAIDGVGRWVKPLKIGDFQGPC